LHHWRTPAEQHALRAIQDAVQKKGIIWTDGAAPGDTNNLENHFATMVRAGVPPGAVQWGNTIEALRERIAMGQFVPVTGLNKDFSSKLIPEVAEITVYDDETLNLPIGIHTYNFMVYNKSILNELGLEPAKSWQELINYGEVLSQRGIYLLSTSDQFWQSRTLFRALIASELSLVDFEKLMYGDDAVDEIIVKPALTTVLKNLVGLKQFAMPKRGDLNWEDASARVVEGRALVQILGDYILPNFVNRQNIVCATTPQSRFMFWGIDSFVLVKTNDENTIAGQKALINAITDPEVLKEYTFRKGGLPVIKGIEPEELDPCNAETLHAWNTQDKIYAINLANQDRYIMLLKWMYDIWLREVTVDIDAEVGEILEEIQTY
jgi:ABC-type glycerol-3-phosphate transport system substrate-binding protein